MLKFMNSFELQAISTNKQFIDFTQAAIPKDENLNLGFSLQMGMDDNQDDNKCSLILGCQSQVNDIPEGNDNPLNLEIAITYHFAVTDPGAFFEVNSETRADILSNLVYLDFRRKLSLAFASVGLASIRFPLSISKLKAMS